MWLLRNTLDQAQASFVLHEHYLMNTINRNGPGLLDRGHPFKMKRPSIHLNEWLCVAVLTVTAISRGLAVW
jgi:hypothetical protein